MKKWLIALLLLPALASVALAEKTLSTSQAADIRAPATAIWQLLTDADAWSEWNSAVIKSRLVEGNGEEEGSVVKFKPLIGDFKPPAKVKLKLVRSEKYKIHEFHARMLGSKIVFGRKLEEKNGVTKVTSYEKITGLMARFISRENLDKEHRMWVDSIKEKLESGG